MRDFERMRVDVERARAEGVPQRDAVLTAPKRVDDLITRAAELGKVMDIGVECDKCRSDAVGEFFARKEPPKEAPAA